jgi:hypothetical protein
MQVGDSWQASIAFGGGSIPDVIRTGKSIARIPARGTFESVEWERGFPCAKLRYELEIAGRDSKESKELQLAGREFKDNDRTRFSQLVWVSLNTGTLIRSDIVLEADVKVDVGGGGGGNNTGPSPQGGGGRMGTGGGAGGKLGGTGGTGINVQSPQNPGGGFGRPGRGQGGNQGGGRQGGSSGSGVFIRQKLFIQMILEK